MSHFRQWWGNVPTVPAVNDTDVDLPISPPQPSAADNFWVIFQFFFSFELLLLCHGACEHTKQGDRQTEASLVGLSL